MPELCPICLGSGLGGAPKFVPLWTGNRSGDSAKCGRCDGKGWLYDKVEPATSELESQVVHKVLTESSQGLNIDDIARLTGLDIPSVYRALQFLKEKGAIDSINGSPVIYYAVESKV